MLDKPKSDKCRQADRNRITYLSCHRHHATLEDVVLGECLQASGFSDADRPMLIWMTEATVGVARAPCGKPGGWCIPRHATINIAITCNFFVAFKLQFFRPVPISTSFRCRFDTLKVTY